jgi:hypothetical protein
MVWSLEHLGGNCAGEFAGGSKGFERVRWILGFTDKFAANFAIAASNKCRIIIGGVVARWNGVGAVRKRPFREMILGAVSCQRATAGDFSKLLRRWPSAYR